MLIFEQVPGLEMDQFQDDQNEVHEYEWTPALAQVQRMKKSRQEEENRLFLYPPENF